METQVDNVGYYDFLYYCDIDRWSSFWHQLKEIRLCNPQSVLEFGSGGSVIGDYFKNNTDIKYRSADIDERLKPDIVADVLQNNIAKKSFDVVCAFEVLEHLPYDDFIPALNMLASIAKEKVIISLPHWGRHFSIDVRLPYFGRWRRAVKLNIFKQKLVFNGQHYWEIGKEDYSLARIKKDIQKSDLVLENDYLCPDSPYHHFFVFKLK